MEKKNNKGLMILIVILCIIIIGLLIYICYDNGFFSNKSKSSNEPQIKNTENQEEQEQELTDTYVKKDLSYKINSIIFSGNMNSQESDDFIKSANVYGTNINDLLNLTDQDKQYLVLNNLFVNDKFKEINSNEEIQGARRALKSNDLSDADLKISSRYIKLNDVNNLYKEYFNHDLPNDKDYSTKCPGFIYDEQTNSYYGFKECGGTGYDVILAYKNRYSIKGNEVYVYVNLGLIKPDFDQDKNGKVYKDLIDNDEMIYKEQLTSKELENIKIDSSNYQDFNEYKFIFAKNDSGIYYFDKIEKAS